MSYPKFVEFDSGHFVIFDASMNHAAVATGVGESPVSAGMCCANRTSNGKFFGCSTTLNMDANRHLSLGIQPLFVGSLYGAPALSSSREILCEIGATSVASATMEVVGDYRIPVAECFSKQRMHDFLEP